MIPSIQYEALVDFSGLPAVRQSCASRGKGIEIYNLPPLHSTFSTIMNSKSPAFDVQKMGLLSASTSTSGDALKVMTVLHGLSQEVFKNLSHALELPWEKYLGEMHEFTAPSKDHLRLVKAGESIPNDWSTLTIVFNAASPDAALVLYGDALSVFSENVTPALSENGSSESSCLNDVTSDWQSFDRLVYYVCPNDDVFYTRTAGALMTPLTCEEYATRDRVRDVNVV